MRPGNSVAMADAGEAEAFLRQYHREIGRADLLYPRLAEVRREIGETGSYTHTPEELAFGARVAWRNSARCIGRLYWQSLQVRDRRHLTDAADVAAECVAHLRTATNGGRIRPVITVFAPDDAAGPPVLIWNEQLVRYAGHLRFEGGYTGDPRGYGLAELATRLGWRPSGGPFDVLPLVVEARHEGPRLFEIPREEVLEVPITHPSLDWFADLALRWHAVPAISNMRLRVGGISYSAAPFNGWYMGTEIGVRNLCDADRYDILPEVGRRLGLDTSCDRTLWRDHALVEVNRAVLHSFDGAGVTIADHHTESARFLKHLAREELAGRSCPADWSWIVPPMSGALTPVFHRYYDEGRPSPDFHLDEAARLRAEGVGPQRDPRIGTRTPARRCPVAHG
ncbi:nitric oxide synthase oxygenase [Streptomyces sp. TS71-3]|uniref:nitric oxide synthase oxygenase n=1 Tax=Streptomyces sp. TS71-3 TaxID=2733862 RepID=UPI001B0477BA|nr:nitric oxide synthase oxygenase [Streptomyces sp. TS71-3]GHJ37789.1 nitric oxide synthase oxygenase [Streptomyces sp. TS71-3]